MSDSVQNKSKPFHLVGIILTILAMWGAVLWMIEGRASVLRNGVDVTLRTEPIDPRDFLRGRFVRLNYAINSVEIPNFTEIFPEDSVLDQLGRDIYVQIALGESGYHEPVGVSLIQPNDGLFIRGRLSSGVGIRSSDGSGTVRAEFGIERFYASESVAPDLEKQMREGAITDVVVAIDASGTAQIRSLKQGERIFFAEELY